MGFNATSQALSLFTGMLAAIAVSGCDPSGFVPGPQPIHGNVYAPYLESVDAPASIHAGDSVSIVLHFSAQATPGLLTDPLIKWDSSSATNGLTTFDYFYYLVSSAERHEPAPDSPPGSTVRQDWTFTQPGTYTYRFWSAASSNQGGTGYPGDITYGMGIPTEPGPTTKLTQVVIEVLPAE